MINETVKEIAISTKTSWCIKQTPTFDKGQNFTLWVAVNNKNIQSLPQKILIWEHAKYNSGLLSITIARVRVCGIRHWHPNVDLQSVNPLKGRGNYIATSNNMKLVHWPLMGGLLHLVQRGGDWAGWGPPINGQCTNFILFDVAI